MAVESFRHYSKRTSLIRVGAPCADWATCVAIVFHYDSKYRTPKAIVALTAAFATGLGVILMSRHCFRWSAFDDETVTRLALALGYYSREKGKEREWLSQKVKHPTEDFVYATKQILQDTWLKKNPRIVKEIVDRLIADGIGPRFRPTTDTEYLGFLRECGHQKTAGVLLAEAFMRFGDEDSSQDSPEDVAGTIVPRYARIRPKEQPTDGRSPYPFQRQAWDGLDAHLAEARHSGVFEGLLVMPTGSGKTFTAVRWLMDRHLRKGGRVLWLAHRYELLEQAAQAFHQCAYLAPERDLLRIRIVSGIHCPSTMISDTDDVVICSVPSLSRRPDIVSQLLSDDSMFLVVDEAHHAPAKSYRRVIDQLRARTPRHLLGLTATPTRTVTEEQPILSRLFGNRKLFEVNIRQLIEEGFLARPYPVRVQTESDVEEGITEADARHLARFDELSEAWQRRIANLGPRNEGIVRHYRQNREKYAKTLIFAINVPHANLLRNRFQEEGFQAEYIASYRPDGQQGDNRAIVERFRNPLSGLDVLINVQMLTEGVDIPNIQTVFLTRPTRSEILVRQMIGRAMRGRAVHGTERAYLVSFEDHWERFVDWESPLDLVMDVLEESTEEKPPVPPGLSHVIPWELIAATVDLFRRLGDDHQMDAFEAIPSGWYVLDREEDGELVHQMVPLYGHQMSCWDALVQDALCHATDGSDVYDPYDEFFHDCDIPRPSHHHAAEVVQHVLATGESPQFEALSGRSAADPYAIADTIWEQDLGRADQARLVAERHELALAKAVYSTLRDFSDAVNRALFDREHPNLARKGAFGEVVFSPLPDTHLTPGPHHDLQATFYEMFRVASEILNLQDRLPDVGVEWTHRVLKGWYGKAYWHASGDTGGGSIRINRLLDSPDITDATLRFLLWHEFLHLHLQQGHTKGFRALERKWPGAIAAERELDTLGERFEITTW